MAVKSKTRYVLLSLFLAATCALVARPASATAQSTARAQIEQTLKQRNAAHDRKDVDGYMRTFTPNYVSENVMGQSVSFAKLRQAMVTGFARRSISNVSWKIASVQAHGDRADVVLITLYKFPVAESKPHAYRKAIADQVWVKRANQWQEQSEDQSLDEIIYSKEPLTELEAFTK